MQEEVRQTPRPRDAIRLYLRRFGIRTHQPDDDCRGCHKVQVISELVTTCKGDIDAFRFFLRFVLEELG